MKNKKLSNVLFIPHGGGPLPLLGDKNHQEMLEFLKRITPTLSKPSAIVMISAHWEEEVATISSAKMPPLIYDYYGFSEESYNIKYPAQGDPLLAKKIFNLLQESGIDAKLDSSRGFDHGMFVPLKIMYPKADIPCVQLSLLKSLDPASHIEIGKALSSLRDENILIIGSGSSFHNMRAFFSESSDEKNKLFEDWLIQTCTSENISPAERKEKLQKWSDAPFAKYCHPREEHLLPLLVCYGFCSSPAKLVFDGVILEKKMSSFLW
ncbi:MAG: dioxygenase [Sulfurimonas sp.]|nr:dioxygenase [Sulfurimonas sp.]